MQVLLYVWPLHPGRLARAFSRYCCRLAPRYFLTRIVVEDGASFDRHTPYVVGLEPHSALPTAMPACFGIPGTVLPDGLRGRTYGLASSIVRVCLAFAVVLSCKAHAAGTF